MSIKVEFADGVFKPLEKVDNIPAGAVCTVLSEDELITSYVVLFRECLPSCGE